MPDSTFCPICRTSRPVIDTDTAYRPTARGEEAVHQTYLDCGHTVNGPVRVVGAYPEGQQ